MHTIAGTPCRATRVALHVSHLISWILKRFAGVAPVSRYTCKKFRCRTSPPLLPGGVAPKFGSEKVSRYTGVSQLQLRVSRYTVQLSIRGSGPLRIGNGALRRLMGCFWARRHSGQRPLYKGPLRGLEVCENLDKEHFQNVISCSKQLKGKNPEGKNVRKLNFSEESNLPRRYRR